MKYSLRRLFVMVFNVALFFSVARSFISIDDEIAWNRFGNTYTTIFPVLGRVDRTIVPIGPADYIGYELLGFICALFTWFVIIGIVVSINKLVMRSDEK